MSFVFCLRGDGQVFEDVTNDMCISWLISMHPTTPPEPGVWSQVPSNLLPDGAAVCYFNASVFLEQVVGRTPPNPRFHIGQVVKLDFSGFSPGARLQDGDLGTILSRGERNEFNHIAYNIKWHRADIIHSMVERRLELSAMDHDTRPLITPRMREENKQEWDRLWHLNKTEECPVCHEKPDIWNGPMNSDVPTRCTHWACVGCWERIEENDKRCPVCRDDLTDWFEWKREISEDESESEVSEDN